MFSARCERITFRKHDAFFSRYLKGLAANLDFPLGCGLSRYARRLESYRRCHGHGADSFLLSPVVILALLVTELVRCYKAKQGERCKSFLFIGLAIVLFVEALAIDYYFLTQLRM